METKNILVGAGVVGAAAGAYYLYKRGQSPVVDIPSESVASEYVPPGVTQDYQDTAHENTQKEKRAQLAYLRKQIASFMDQQRQKMRAASQAERRALREEYKEKYAELQGKLLELQREREAEGKHTPIDREKDVKDVVQGNEVHIDENAIVRGLQALVIIKNKDRRVAAAKAMIRGFRKAPYPERRAAVKYAQEWFKGLSFERKKAVYELLKSVGFGQIIGNLWRQAQKKKKGQSGSRATDEKFTERSSFVSAEKELPKEALVAAVAALERETNLGERRRMAQEFRASLPQYTKESKQRAMQYASTWFRNQPFEVKKRVYDVMVSIGMAQNLKAAWEAAQKKHQEQEDQKAAKDHAKSTLQSRAITETYAQEIELRKQREKEREEAARKSAEQEELEEVQTEVLADRAKTIDYQDYSNRSSDLTESRKKALEMRALQTLINITMRFPKMTAAQQRLTVRTVRMQLTKLPRDSQRRVVTLYVAWFNRRPKKFKDKVKSILEELK